jgi:hypothetical protein
MKVAINEGSQEKSNLMIVINASPLLSDDNLSWDVQISFIDLKQYKVFRNLIVFDPFFLLALCSEHKIFESYDHISSAICNQIHCSSYYAWCY